MFLVLYPKGIFHRNLRQRRREKEKMTSNAESVDQYFEQALQAIAVKLRNDFSPDRDDLTVAHGVLASRLFYRG